MLIEEIGRGNLNTENPNMFGLGLRLGMGEVRLRRKMIGRNMVGTPRLYALFQFFFLFLYFK